ncbi:hypothetical protein FEP08_05590 [Burkholderia multivorans]|nr:hypothetical protein [Burkholderia multivorans]
MRNYLEVPFDGAAVAVEGRSQYACTIGELPQQLQAIACEDATKGIAGLIGRSSTRPIEPREPVYSAFSMPVTEAEQHEFRAVLRMIGAELPLTYCMITRTSAKVE